MSGMDEARAAYDQAAGIDSEEEQISYFKEMLFSSTNQMGLAGTLLTAFVLAIVSGLGFAVLPVLFFMLMQTLASLFIPSSPVFQRMIDRRHAAERRKRTRDELLRKLADPYDLERRTSMGAVADALVTREIDLGRVPWKEGLADYQSTWLKMRERMVSLRKMATSSKSGPSDHELEKLEDATTDFLRLVLARMNLKQRMSEGQDGEIEGQLSDIDHQLEATTNTAVKSRLQKARNSLQAILDRRRDLPARDTTIAAQLLAMGETFEEIHHRVVSNPNAGSIGDFLTEATERLSIEEELSVAAATEVDAGMSSDVKERMARVAEKARQRQLQ